MKKLQLSQIYCRSGINCMILTLAILIVFFPLSVAFAQDSEGGFEANDFGLLAHTNSLFSISTYPGISALSNPWIGFIFHNTKNIAIKPAFMINKTDREEKEGSDAKSDFLTYGFEIGIYYYIDPVSSLSIYIGPLFQYIKTSSETTFSSYTIYAIETKSKNDTKTLGAAFCIGAQYMLSERFGFFADIGIGYEKSDEKIKTTETWMSSGTIDDDNEEEITSMFTRGGSIGAVFYFN